MVARTPPHQCRHEPAEQVEPVAALARSRRPRARARGVLAAAVTADQLDARMCPQPLGERRGGAVGEELGVRCHGAAPGRRGSSRSVGPDGMRNRRRRGPAASGAPCRGRRARGRASPSARRGTPARRRAGRPVDRRARSRWPPAPPPHGRCAARTPARCRRAARQRSDADPPAWRRRTCRPAPQAGLVCHATGDRRGRACIDCAPVCTRRERHRQAGQQASRRRARATTVISSEETTSRSSASSAGAGQRAVASIPTAPATATPER